MAITLGSSTEQNGTGNNTTTQSFTFDIGTLTNGLLVVSFGLVTPLDRTISSITWNGVAMDFVTTSREVVAGIFHTPTIAWLANPANGSNTLEYNTTAAVGSTSTVSIMPAWFNGAHQTQASVKDQDTSGSGSTDPSIGPITPTENAEMVFANYISEANNVLTIGAWADAELQNYDSGPRVFGCGYKIQTTAAAITATWTGVDDEWTGLIASFKQAAAPPATGNPWYLYRQQRAA
jgi:hypothetical protein